MKTKQEPIVMKRKIVTLGKQPKKNYSFLLVSLIVLILFCSTSSEKIDWELINDTPTVQNENRFFKSLKIKHYFNNVIVATPGPDIKIEFPPSEKNEIKPSKKKSSYSDNPNYHAYDHIIVKESKKINIDPAIIKGIIEQESRYQFDVFAYVPKWETKYAKMIPKQKSENVEKWRMNFSSIGLMQVGYILHKDFCGLNSYADLLNPEINIRCGVKIFGRCLETGLSKTQCIKAHNGSGPDAEKYKHEVLSRVARIVANDNKSIS